MPRKDTDNLLQTIDDLASDKATERQQARDAVRRVFQESSAVLHFDKKGDGQAWLAMFQGLFQSYKKELLACTKNGAFPDQVTGRGSVAVKRLGDVASVTRWLTERSIERLNTRVLKSIFSHLTHAIVYQGRLLPPVALDYAKTIYSILRHKPHLYALKDHIWHQLVALAFNVVLGRQPKRRLAEDLEDDAVGEDSDADMEEAQSPTESEAGPSTLKRRRQDPLSPLSRGSPSVHRASQPVSLEQIEFMSILAVLFSSPTAPLLSEPAELDEDKREAQELRRAQDPHGYPRIILKHFTFFLHKYTGDTSLHHDFLIALSCALSQYTLNCRQVVRPFAHDNWQSLVAMWGTKNQALKGHLLVTLRLLFPMLTATPLDGETRDCTDALVALWYALETSTQGRGTLHDLSLDKLQLRLSVPTAEVSSQQAFEAETFQHGWHFDAEQALSWAILQLQADCAEKLYLRSESICSTIASFGKRRKLDNPVSSLLLSIKSPDSQQTRTHHLQILLFLIDRHWQVLHEELRRDITSALVPLVSFEDAVVQSWTFMCLAAIAHSECTPLTGSLIGSSSPHPDVAATWDPIWTHAMRRANVPAVSRAACHAAHILLVHSKRLLSSQRVLAEIESFAKDLDVQGPAYPYDSVCDFIVLCLRVANQDVRLYRMQMEEKILSWLMESWRIGSERRTTMPLHTVAHMHTLLEGIIGSSRRVKLSCGMMMPQSTIVDAMVEETQTKVIRDFQLHAHLPPYRHRRDPSLPDSASSLSDPADSSSKTMAPFGDSTDLAPPRGRERRLSAFLLKSLEERSMALASREAGYGFPTAERIRSTLDLAVIALCFEASLLMNGTQSNRRVLQAACKLLTATVPLLTDTRWKSEERRLMLDAFEPLIRADDVGSEHVQWETLVQPTERTGIKTQVLKKLLAQSHVDHSHRSLRRDLQKFVFRSTDVQDTFTQLLGELRNVLRLAVGRTGTDDSQPMALADDGDGFGPVRSGHATAAATTRDASAESIHDLHVVRTCIIALAVIPILHSSSGEPTRDRDLTELVLNSEPGEFLMLAPAFCEQVHQRLLYLSTPNLEALLERLGDICGPYTYKHRPETLMLVVQVLHATSHIWLQSSVVQSNTGDLARFYCWETVKRLQTTRERSWRVQDAIIRFLDEYLLNDPKLEIWQLPIDDAVPDPEDLPVAVLPTLGSDVDIRLRFRVAAVSPRLFAAARLAGRDLEKVYKEIHSYLSAEQNDYESILSRLLCLGNMVISEASIRRAAYWHLLEIAYYSTTYLPHLKAVLVGVVERLGIETLADLFNCYASQFAYSIRQARIDLFKFPPELLGYRDRKDCAVSTFRAFTPTNLMAQGTVEDIRYGRSLFTRHCQTIQKTMHSGVEECFSELAGYQIVHSSQHNEEDIDHILKDRIGYANEDAEFHELLGRNADGIVVAILRTIGDQDISPDGTIAYALETASSTVALETFRMISKYRVLETFQAHGPNLPAYPTTVVLRAIDWCRSRISGVDTLAVTYHVLQQLFADIEHTPLVNEQYRLINAASVWIACHHDHFQDESLLRTLTRRAVTMLAQVDLARAAQSILGWCLSRYKVSTKKADYRLADVLIRISTVAHDFAQQSDDNTVSKLGVDILDWAEKQADGLRRNGDLQKQVLRALAAWPRELPPALQAACERVPLADLTSVLAEQGVSASKFRLVRRIHDLESNELEPKRQSEDRFGGSDFWRLKACIPPQRYLVDSDMDAFVSLLMLHYGQVDSLGSDRFVPESVCVLHRKSAEPRSGPYKTIPPRIDVHRARAGIVVSMRAMLDTSSAVQVHVAYDTLRTIMSIPSSESYIGPNCPEDIRKELEYLQSFVRPFAESPAPDVSAILRSEDTIQLCKDADIWIARISTILCEVLGTRDPFFAPLAPMLQADHDFAEDVLPVLVHSLLQIEHDTANPDAPDSIRSLLSSYFTAVLSFEECALSCYRAIINVVLHLRHFDPNVEPKDALAYDKWLVMDYTLLSRCAVKCSAYTTALLFLELAAEYPERGNTSDGSTTENILFEIYSHIDEPDGFYGIQTEDLRNFFVKRLRHENQWDKAFRFHGAVVESGSASSSDADGIVQSLYAFGFNQLALNTMQDFSVDASTTMNSSSLAYNLGWRAETWDLPDNLGNTDSGAALYLALRAVYRERSSHVVDSVLRRAFVQEMNRLRDLGSENFTDIRQVTQNLMCLAQVRQWRSEDLQKDLQSKQLVATRWEQFSSLDSAFDFANIEAIMATRISLVRSIRQKEQRDQIGVLTTAFCDSLLELEKACLLCLSERARDAHQTQIALNSVVRAQNLEQSPSSKVSQEFANVLWSMKEPKLAIQSLGTLTSSVSLEKAKQDTEQCVQHALLLARLGTWSAEASMKKPSQIRDDCFTPAATLILGIDSDPSLPRERHATIFHQYAIFAERQYHAISKSPDALRWKLYVDRKKEEIKQRSQQMKRAQPNTKEWSTLRRQQHQAEMLLRQDSDQFREHFQQRNTFLALAIEMYSRCLADTDKFDEDSPIRLCSLWLANFDNDEPSLQFGDMIQLVPSRKFVFLAHQLTARLSKSEGSPSHNQEALQRVIHSMGREHPFHSLFPLYCLRLDRSSSQASNSLRRQSGRHDSPAPSQLERAAAVADVFNKLRMDPHSGQRVRDVEHVCDASLEWAKYPIKGQTRSKSQPTQAVDVPHGLQILSLNNIHVPVITASTPIDPTMKYENCVWISCYEKKYTTAGGVNLPKIMRCRGSDGKWYKQLFKGEGDDDLRQDAVMEQVFDLVNVVLRHDRDTQKRKLGVRGYKVIPLAAQAGVLEFVQNTTPLASWLRPAHSRYHPDDLSQDQFSKAFASSDPKEWHNKPQEVIKRFTRLRAKFRPVMRHYFREKHKTPLSWFAMRLHYARSVATTSIVGHILGLGDRHTSNILMDNKTGEVVHIDLGIAFEQGKLLPQPERVPFRLTADMVDGLGISGTQGVFQRCAEETLRVLRDGSETILTVLEVFKYDPLHSWTASEFKIKRAQAGLSDETAQLTGEAFRFAIGIDMASGATDEAADRALSTVARKLDKTLSVEYTVNELITEASDPANLALMYIGWAPHW